MLIPVSALAYRQPHGAWTGWVNPASLSVARGEMKNHRCAGVRVFIAVLLLCPPTAQAQWTTIGDMPSPRRGGNTLTFQNARAVVSVTAVASDIVRVRFAPARALDRDHSYAIVNRELGDAKATVRTGDRQSEIVTPSLTVTI